LELPFDQPGVERADNIFGRFQSLFYWNCRLIKQQFINVVYAYYGFNPYFIGIAV